MFENKKKKNLVLVPSEMADKKYIGKVYGKYHRESGVYNIFSDEIKDKIAHDEIGEIYQSKELINDSDKLSGYWEADSLFFQLNDTCYDIKYYDMFQNIFSRNTGILESEIMRSKCVFILGCGSVGSLIALELARAGVGKFVLVDNDVLEYHNICRHQCSISDVGEYKVNVLKKRIWEINPLAEVETFNTMVEMLPKEVFDDHVSKDNTIFVGCADNRAADVYANSIAVMYKAAFISIGFWERAFAGEIFYYLPNSNMACYKCALGDGSGLSQRSSVNRRIYTTEENLEDVNFEPGISVDINFVTTIGIKLILDILNRDNEEFTPRLLGHLTQYTLICNTNNPKIGGEMAEIFSYPLQVTTSLEVTFGPNCPQCEFE